MKISINIVSGMLLMIPLYLQTGCKDEEKKLESAKADVQEARQELNNTKEEGQLKDPKAIETAEWKRFKAESEETIQKNEKRIIELKENIKKSGKHLDARYERKIENLDKKNKELKDKISSYDMSESNWESFKKEFKHDLNELGTALKDLTTDNKN